MTSAERLRKIDRTICFQREFLHRVPDPDTRDRAEGNLVTLVQMRDALAAQSPSLSQAAHFADAAAETEDCRP